MMHYLLKRAALLLAISTCASANFVLPASADSTAGLVLQLQCQRGKYNINIWRKHSSGELLYRAKSHLGALSLGKGTSELTEGVRVYKFQNGDAEYWVWDGTLDDQGSGALDVYQNKEFVRRYDCTKS